MVVESPRRDTGRRAGLDRQLIGDAALELIDSEGSSALTMRRLAARLDVTPMALYNHVDDRAHIERLVVDSVFAEAAELAVSGGAEDGLGQLARHLRGLYLKHPNAMGLVQTVAPTGMASLGLIERALQLLTAAGHGIETSRRIWVGLVSVVNGHVAYELQGHFSEPAVAKGLPKELPLVREAVGIGPLDRDASFDDAVSNYLRGAERNAESDWRRRPRP